MPEIKKNDELTVLTADTVIDGDITSSSAMKISGEVKGNVTSTKKIEILGRIIGDVVGDSIVLSAGYVEGNIEAKTDVVISDGMELLGDVKAENLTSGGKIKGTIDINRLIALDGSAVCEGSISASLINIKTGAKIKGPITIYEADDAEFKEKKVKRSKSEADESAIEN